MANTVSLDVAPFISGFSSGISKFVLISNIGLFRQVFFSFLFLFGRLMLNLSWLIFNFTFSDFDEIKEII